MGAIWLVYEGGHPNIPVTGDCVWIVCHEGDKYVHIHGWKMVEKEPTTGELKACIPGKDIIAVDHGSSQSPRGDAVGGAIGGGLLLGPIGALAGALLGGGTRSRSHLVVNVMIKGFACTLHFSGTEQAVAQAHTEISATAIRSRASSPDS